MVRQYSFNDFDPTVYRQTFFANLGRYFQLIITELGKSNKVQLVNEEYTDNIPFRLPKTWTWSTLGEVVEFTSNCNIQAQYSADTIINYVDIDAIDNKEFKIREVKTKKVAELSSRARRVLKKGYMVYSLVRPYLNNIAVIELDKENFIGSTGFAVFKGTRLKNEFLKFILLSEYVRESYLEMLSGFNSPGITQDQFVNTKVPVAPITMQEAIISFLSDLEDNRIRGGRSYFDKDVEEKILNLHYSQLLGKQLSNEISSQQEILQLLRQAILQEAVQGKLTPQFKTDEPASELLRRIKAEKQKLLKEGKLKKEKELPPITEEEIPFELPNGWVWCRLGDVVKTIGDVDHKMPKETQVGIPYISPKDFYGDNKIDFANAKKISKADFINLSKKIKPEKYDIIFSRYGTIGVNRFVYDDIEFLVSYSCAVIKTLKELSSPDYLFLFSISPLAKDEIQKHVVKTTQPNVGIKSIYEFLFPLPPLAEQFRIVAKFEQLRKHIDQLEQQVANSQSHTQQLLQIVLKEAFEKKLGTYDVKELDLNLAAEI